MWIGIVRKLPNLRSAISIVQEVEVERTVRFLVMFEKFEVRSLAKIMCSDMFEVRFWWFWKKLGPFFINKVLEQFGLWWCSRGSKFGFEPKWDVWMCSKFDPVRFGMFFPPLQYTSARLGQVHSFYVYSFKIKLWGQ